MGSKTQKKHQKSVPDVENSPKTDDSITSLKEAVHFNLDANNLNRNIIKHTKFVVKDDTSERKEKKPPSQKKQCQRNTVSAPIECHF